MSQLLSATVTVFTVKAMHDFVKLIPKYFIMFQAVEDEIVEVSPSTGLPKKRESSPEPSAMAELGTCTAINFVPTNCCGSTSCPAPWALLLSFIYS
jgi:hypothetical protein